MRAWLPIGTYCTSMPRGIPGPVIKKMTRKAPSTAFKPGHPGGPGRPKGVPNKFTGDIRDAILEGINTAHPEGIVGFVRALAQESPTAVGALLGRFVPMQSEVGKPGDFSRKTDAELRDIIERGTRAISSGGPRIDPPQGEDNPSGAGRLN